MQCSLLKSFHSLDLGPMSKLGVFNGWDAQAGQKHKYLKEFLDKAAKNPDLSESTAPEMLQSLQEILQHIFRFIIASTGIIVEFGSLMPSHASEVSQSIGRSQTRLQQLQMLQWPAFLP